MIKSIVISTVSGLVIHFGMHWLPRLFPYHPSPGATRWSLEQLKRLYARVDRFMINLMVIGPAALSFIWYLLLVGWWYLAYPNPGTPGMIITPSWFYWVVVANSAGWASLGVAWHPILRRVLGPRYAEFCLYKKWKLGRALPVVYKAGKVACTLMVVVVFYALSATYTVFQTDRVIIAKPFRMTMSHPYYDIVEIRAVTRPSGGTKKRARSRYEIEFTDGTVWHAGMAFNWTKPCTTFPYIAFAAERSRRPITGPDLYGEADCR